MTDDDIYQSRFPEPIDIDVPHITSDSSIDYDFDIVYVRVPRSGDDVVSRWPEIAHPVSMDPGGDLMLLHPDGREDLLVEGGAGTITDPVISLDGEWVFFSKIHDMEINWAGRYPAAGADIYKLHLSTGELVQLTDQSFTPNTGAADWSSDYVSREDGKTYLDYGVFNMGPYPLPDGRIIFTSNRNAFIPPDHPGPTLQLFVMDDDGANVECIGHFNIGSALHPVTLRDGRVMFSSLESQALRNSLLWGLWTIHPDGTNWAPMISAFDTGGAPNAFHFQSQISDGSIIAEEYYNQNNSGFGAYVKLPPQVPSGETSFGPGDRSDSRNPPLRFGRFYNAKPKIYRLPFSPFGIESFTRFANNGEGPADSAVLNDNGSPRVGKFTHPSGAPDNHLLTVFTLGPANHQNGLKPPSVDGGIYLVKDGRPVDQPAEMRLIKNDPRYNEQFPRAVVSYRDIYSVTEPHAIAPLANNGSLSPHLPRSTPFGLVGSSSLYKRESYPEGRVLDGTVTATAPDRDDRTGYSFLDPFNTSQNGASLNWTNQGADAGRYENSDIHAIRILVMEPTTDRHHGPDRGRRFYSHAMERLRILGEIPVRKFLDQSDELELDSEGLRQSGLAIQAMDPDGNPDTSFLAKIPADVAFTFQTIDRNGMNLNMSQTWHQLRPGEMRTDCGGCHAHSQPPTLFEATAAANEDDSLFDLTESTPLITTRERDESSRRWDTDGETGLRELDSGVVNVEYYRDVVPILQRSCIPCHQSSDDHEAEARLDLDQDHESIQIPNRGSWPGTYYRLAVDQQARYGYPPIIHNGVWRQTNASRYIRKFQSRRSLLVWKIYGQRMDGWTNDDFPSARELGDPDTLEWHGEPIENTQANRDRADLDYRGSIMPPPEAVESGIVERLTDEDRRTIVRWIDLGCPIDFDFEPSDPNSRGFGWAGDDQRPTLTLTSPSRVGNEVLEELLIGYHDIYSGIDASSFSVVADFPIDDRSAGEELADLFHEETPGVFVYELETPIRYLDSAKIRVSISDDQGNRTTIDRTFDVGSEATLR